MTKSEWIAEIAPLAVKACKEMGGYLPSILIAQTCLENGYGMDKSCDILVEHNNILGMKTVLLPYESDWWDGHSDFEKVTPEWVNSKRIDKPDRFRAYVDFYHCLMDYLQFMKEAKYSSGAHKYRDTLSYTDPYTLISTVGGRGYATDPAYADSVMRIVQEHNLTRFDPEKEVETMSHTIIDITGRNKSQVPASRGSNPIEWIVVHYLGVPNADNPNLYGGGYGGHYNVTRTGSIYKAADPRTAVVWQCGGGIQGEGPGAHKYHRICTNYNSIGIECGVCADTTAKDLSGDSNLWYFTEATQESCAWLVAQLMKEYGIALDHVIRHYDVTGKTCPNPYVLNNKRKTSWTWDEFKTRVSAIYGGVQPSQTAQKGTETADRMLRRGDSGADVKAMQELLYKAGFCGCSYYYNGGKARFVDGQFGPNTDTAVRRLQEAVGLDVDGIYGPASKKALTALTKGSKLIVTVTEFLVLCRETAAENKALGFRYGDAPCMPSIYPQCKLTSCDRFVDQCLYAAGLHDVGNRSVSDLSAWLLKKGGQKVEPDKVQAGDICFMKGHTFILGNPVGLGNGTWERYDSGSLYRIQLTGPYSGYKTQPFREGLAGLLYAIRMPFKAEPEGTDREVYRVQVGAYSVKANADRMLKRAISSGFNAFIQDYGEGVKDRYRVQIGAYGVYSNAKKQRQRALDAGFNCIVRKEKLT